MFDRGGRAAGLRQPGREPLHPAQMVAVAHAHSLAEEGGALPESHAIAPENIRE